MGVSLVTGVSTAAMIEWMIGRLNLKFPMSLTHYMWLARTHTHTHTSTHSTHTHTHTLTTVQATSVGVPSLIYGWVGEGTWGIGSSAEEASGVDKLARRNGGANADRSGRGTETVRMRG